MFPVRLIRFAISLEDLILAIFTVLVIAVGCMVDCVSPVGMCSILRAILRAVLRATGSVLTNHLFARHGCLLALLGDRQE